MDTFRKSLIAIAVLAALVGLSLFAGSLIAPPSTTAAAETDKEKAPRNFYLSKTLHNGAQALSACAFGYHMASLWEILDPSNLRYDTQLGFTNGDSGLGLPTAHDAFSDNYGWVRTGAAISPVPSNVPGVSNCQAWTSASETDLGTRVGIFGWENPGTRISPWDAFVYPCNVSYRVWCVQD